MVLSGICCTDEGSGMLIRGQHGLSLFPLSTQNLLLCLLGLRITHISLRAIIEVLDTLQLLVVLVKGFFVLVHLTVITSGEVV